MQKMESVSGKKKLSPLRKKTFSSGELGTLQKRETKKARDRECEVIVRVRPRQHTLVTLINAQLN